MDFNKTFFTVLCISISEKKSARFVAPGWYDDGTKFRWLRINNSNLFHRKVDDPYAHVNFQNDDFISTTYGVVHKLCQQDYGFFDHLPPPFTFSTLRTFTKSQHFFNYLPPPSCKRSLWMSPILIWQRATTPI